MPLQHPDRGGFSAMARLLLFSLAALTVWSSAAAQDQVQIKLYGVQPVKFEDGLSGFEVQLATNLPEGVSVFARFRFHGYDIVESWGRNYVDDRGLCVIEMGPFEKEVLPGAYQFEFIVDPAQQDFVPSEEEPDSPPPLELYFQSWKQALTVVDVFEHHLELAEQKRQEMVRELTAIVEGVERQLDEVIEVGKQYRARSRFFDASGKNFRGDEFRSWAEEYWKKVLAFKKRHALLKDAYLAPYFPKSLFFILPDLFVYLQLVAVDYTIYPIHKREKLSVPPHFEPLRDIFIRPTREMSIDVIRRDLTRVRVDIGAWKAKFPVLKLMAPASQYPEGYYAPEVPEPFAEEFAKNPFLATEEPLPLPPLGERYSTVSLQPEEMSGLYILWLTPGGLPEGYPSDAVRVVVFSVKDIQKAQICFAAIYSVIVEKELQAKVYYGEFSVVLVETVGERPSASARAACRKLSTYYGSLGLKDD